MSAAHVLVLGLWVMFTAAISSIIFLGMREQFLAWGFASLDAAAFASMCTCALSMVATLLAVYRP